VMPSKFQVGNVSVSLLIFFILGLPFIFTWPGLTAYLWCPIAVFAALTMYQHRDKRHNTKTLDALLYENIDLLEKANNNYNEVVFQLELLRKQQREGGD